MSAEPEDDSTTGGEGGTEDQQPVYSDLNATPKKESTEEDTSAPTEGQGSKEEKSSLKRKADDEPEDKKKKKKKKEKKEKKEKREVTEDDIIQSPLFSDAVAKAVAKALEKSQGSSSSASASSSRVPSWESHLFGIDFKTPRVEFTKKSALLLKTEVLDKLSADEYNMLVRPQDKPNVMKTAFVKKVKSALMAGQDKNLGGDHYSITEIETKQLIMFANDSTKDALE